MFVVVAKKVNKYGITMCYSGFWINKTADGNKVMSEKFNISKQVALKLSSVYKLKHLIELDKDNNTTPLENLVIKKFTTFGKVHNSGGELRFYHKDDRKSSVLVTEFLNKEEYLESDVMINSIEGLTTFGYDYNKETKDILKRICFP